MKSYCPDCAHFKDQKCAKNLKNGYNNCKKIKPIPIPVLKKEKEQLLLDGTNPERLKILTEKLQAIEGY